MGLESKGKAKRNTDREQKAEAGLGQEYHQTRDDNRYLSQTANVYFRFWNFRRVSRLISFLCYPENSF